MTEEEIKQLMREGRTQFAALVAELNEIAKEVRPSEEHRRQSDYQELCIALALQQRRANITPQAVQIALQPLLNWDLSDDPHGYADEYDAAIRKAALLLGVKLY